MVKLANYMQSERRELEMTKMTNIEHISTPKTQRRRMGEERQTGDIR